MISRIKYIMEHHSFFRKVVPICRKVGLVHFLHRIKSDFDRIGNRDKRKEFQDFYEEHKNDFERLSKMLEDDFSRETLQRILDFRKNWKIKVLRPIIVNPQYFPKDIFECTEKEVLIDGGAYVGDTVEEFLNWVRRSGGGGVFKNICMGTRRKQCKANAKESKTI